MEMIKLEKLSRIGVIGLAKGIGLDRDVSVLKILGAKYL
jgi:hypothetical protein